MNIDARPLFPEIGVIALVPDHWEDPWQPRHHVLSQLARYFYIIWVNPAVDWRGSFRSHMLKAVKCAEMAPPFGLVVYDSASWPPRFYHPKWLATLSVQLRLNKARELLASQGCKKTILYLWRPEFEEALARVSFDLSCYHIDDEYSFSSLEQPIADSEARLLAHVDQVFIHSPGLMEKKGRINRHTTFVPNGVDYQAYTRILPQPSDLASVPRPRIGYTGWIKKNLDWPLILQLIQNHSNWSFVFVGPRSPHSEIIRPLQRISELPNAYLLDPKPTSDLPGYPQHFDVCIMPYVLNSYTKYIYPLKLHEYLASGRPVVGAPIRSLEEFSRVVALADGYEEWSAELRKALSPESNTVERVAARQAVARRHDWQVLVAVIAKTMLQRLGVEYPDRIKERIDHILAERTA